VHIVCVKNHGIEYLQVQESYTVKEYGAVRNRKRVLRNIGPLTKYDDGKPDYLKRLRQSLKDGTPLIESLSDLVGDKKTERRVTVTFDLADYQACTSVPKNIGHFLLDGLYDALGIYDVLNKHKSQRRIQYDLNGLAKLLVFGRVLDPDSKLGTFEGRGQYLFDVTGSDHLFEMYRALDCLDEKADAIQKRMNHKISHGKIGRNTEVCFYDVTNFYYEIDQNDADVVDKDGKLVTLGLRKKGVSKENRKEPITQMGLFIDDNGLPIAYQLFPGNHTDQTTLRPAMKKTIDSMDFGKVIVVADGGLNSGPNLAHILNGGNGYIVSKSTKKSDKHVKKWILDEDGYEYNEKGTFKVKSKIRTRKIKDEDGREMEIKEKLICYWSKKHYDKEVHENAKFIDYLNSLIANPDKLKDKPRKVEQFLAKTVVDKESGEIIETADTILSIDMEKVRTYLDLMGYYTIMTSERDKPDSEIINKYHGLSRIEDSFRITKGSLSGRPVFVNTPGHINAHFLVCFIALSTIRLIQYKVLNFQGKDTLNVGGWESGVTADRIQKALKSWSADALPGGYFRLTKPNDDLLVILNSFGIDHDLRLPTATQLRQLKYSFDKSSVI